MDRKQASVKESEQEGSKGEESEQEASKGERK